MSNVPVKKIAGVVGFGSLFAVAQAQAALPPYIAEAFTEMKTNATDLIAEAWPILILVFGGLVLMKLFKKFGNRATS